MAAATLRVYRTGGTITFQIDGRISMAQSAPLRRLAESALADGVAFLHVDLRKCLYVDSTFVGTLLVLQRAACDRANFAILSPSPQCQRILESLGLSRRFPVIECEEAPSHVWEELDVSAEDRGCLKFHVCESHQELVAVGGATALPFRAVAETMRRELDDERRPRSD